MALAMTISAVLLLSNRKQDALDLLELPPELSFVRKSGPPKVVEFLHGDSRESFSHPMFHWRIYGAESEIVKLLKANLTPRAGWQIVPVIHGRFQARKVVGPGPEDCLEIYCENVYVKDSMFLYLTDHRLNTPKDWYAEAETRVKMATSGKP